MPKFFTAALLLLALPAVATPRYTVTEVGPLHQEDTFAVNNSGQVVGSVSGQPWHPHGGTTPAFLWAHGRRTVLRPILGYENVLSCTVNDRGQVAGSLGTTQDGATLSVESHAFIWRQGRFRDIGKEMGERHTEAMGIDAGGRVVGWALGSDRPVEDDPGLTAPRAFVYAGGRPVYLGPGKALAFNRRGQAVGEDGLEAVLWEQGQERRLGVEGRAVAINGAGQVLINGGRPGLGCPFLWQNGRLRALPLLPSGADCLASALNGVGEVVGTLGADTPNARRALLWRDGRVFDLNTLLPPRYGWVLETATGINAKGQIVGAGLFHGKQHAYLLTPPAGPRPRM